MTRHAIALVLLGVFATFAIAQPAPKEAKGNRFRVGLDSKMTTTGGGKKTELEAAASADYSWQRNDKTRTLFFGGMTMKLNENGKEVSNTTLSRAGLFNHRAGEKSDITYEDAPEPIREMFRDLFDSPICEIEVDAVGKEIKRKVLAGRGAAGIVNDGFIANCTMFHPWYSPDKDEWRADMEVSASGTVVKGPLTYKKTPGGKVGQQLVKVSGTLSPDGLKDRKGNTTKNGKYIITGQQTYDTARKEWIAGRWAMDIAFTLTNADKEVGRAKGNMTVTFEMLPEKK